MVSVIIPSRRERFLNETIRDLQKNLRGDYEIIVTLDGANEERLEGVRYIYNKKAKGMRTAINQAVAIAEGDYIMKLDAHCMVDEGIDLKLLDKHQEKWVQAPTRKRLIAGDWKIDNSRDDINYMYLNSDHMGVVNRTQDREGMLDETQIFQGSCYFINRDYFLDLGLLDAENFGGSGYEALEIATKVRHDGGKVMRNKYTWYAHARLGRKYRVDRSQSREYVDEFMEKYG